MQELLFLIQSNLPKVCVDPWLMMEDLTWWVSSQSASFQEGNAFSFHLSWELSMYFVDRLFLLCTGPALWSVLSHLFSFLSADWSDRSWPRETTGCRNLGSPCSTTAPVTKYVWDSLLLDFSPTPFQKITNMYGPLKKKKNLFFSPAFKMTTVLIRLPDHFLHVASWSRSLSLVTLCKAEPHCSLLWLKSILSAQPWSSFDLP